MSTADDRMARYVLVAVVADVKGFRHLAPAGGVDDPHAAYFFQLRCIGCGQLTAKDVCLHPPASQRTGSRIVAPAPCSYKVRASSSARFVRANCYPTCCNPGHLVRKCKQCGLLGSVELIPGTGEPMAAGSHVLMALECIGYKPWSFCPGSEWVITTMDGGEIEVEFTGNSFVGAEDGADSTFSIDGVKFYFLKGNTE